MSKAEGLFLVMLVSYAFASPMGCDPAILGTAVCDSSLDPSDRAAALVDQLTISEILEQVHFILPFYYFCLDYV